MSDSNLKAQRQENERESTKKAEEQVKSNSQLQEFTSNIGMVMGESRKSNIPISQVDGQEDKNIKKLYFLIFVFVVLFSSTNPIYFINS